MNTPARAAVIPLVVAALTAAAGLLDAGSRSLGALVRRCRGGTGTEDLIVLITGDGPRRGGRSKATTRRDPYARCSQDVSTCHPSSLP